MILVNTTTRKTVLLAQKLAAYMLLLAFAISAHAAAPGPTIVTGPVGAINDTTPTFEFNAVAEATWYKIWVSVGATKMYETWYTIAQADCPSGTGTCSLTPTITLGNGTVAVWIQSWNAMGRVWSPRHTFSIVTPPVATALTAPTGVIGDNTPTYTWPAIGNSSWYKLYVNQGATNLINTWYSPADAGCEAGNGTCSVTPTTPLANGNVVAWVQTWNVAGSVWSVRADFVANGGTMTGYPPGDVELCNLVNAYRAEHNLPAVPLSRALMTVARNHTLDYAANNGSYGQACNAHSWGDPVLSGMPASAWNQCCYTSNHNNAQCMWSKPTEVTSMWTMPLQPFTGNGYENFAGGYGDNASALNGWKNSPGHNDVILNLNGWANLNWQSMGCGSDLNSSYYLIFSDTADPNPAP